MFAYSDESGSPGVALHGNDWFLVAIIIFKSKEARDAAKLKVIELKKRLNLPEGYEFHHVEDSKVIQKHFYQLIYGLDFKYKVYSMKKTGFRKDVSMSMVAERVVNDLKDIGRISIIMDENPKLYQKLCKAKKKYRVKSLYVKEISSKKCEQLQIVDYVVAYEMMKIRRKLRKIPDGSRELDKKCLRNGENGV